MTIFELRQIALGHACNDSRTHTSGQTFQAEAEDVVKRAGVYLSFLTGDSAKQEQKARNKRR